MKYRAQLDEVSRLVLVSQRGERAQSQAVIVGQQNSPQNNRVGVYRLDIFAAGRDRVLAVAPRTCVPTG